MEIQENIPLAPMTTFKVGGPARYFAEAAKHSDVIEAVRWARDRKCAMFVLGGGSNLVVSDTGWPGLVLRISLRGTDQREANGRVEFNVAAGEDWDGFVAQAVAQGCGGVETLSGIPGTVGGTPVQNVGAYGQEVAETITSVRVLDLSDLSVKELSKDDCGFEYRTSIFNTTQKGRYIVLAVTYVLQPGAIPRIAYADLKKYFANFEGAPSLQQVRDAVREIRLSKAMLIVRNDDDCRSAGSFFKNPIVATAKHAEVSDKAKARGVQSEPPKYPAGEGRVKLSAAWLVENSGFHKGYTRGPVGISRRHALAIVNRGGAKAADILALKDEVQAGVREVYGIELQPEPAMVGF